MSFQFVRASRPLRKPQIAGSKNPHWRGGIIVTKDGRVMVHAPDHPHPSKGRYVYRYRLVMEQHIGRHLSPAEVVHHINGKKDDDRLENLQLMTNTEHSRMHGANPNGGRWSRRHDSCEQCGTTEGRHKGHGVCTRCTDKARWPRRARK